ncbi:hypothetical protein RA28_05430 [Ruegeria sp. ANG-S4]|uniref:hypothetical protein n=1 Tax=Ruegeria sp. ANG-S4 TaxID=1577904 RepID=UPI00057C7079|nr:hypothetical protein [Ruegeria sp. ANG-S4]KIC47132.1 hypothetical protein RA28_05430 [Ruegeria sp. ANG-S4]
MTRFSNALTWGLAAGVFFVTPAFTQELVVELATVGSNETGTKCIFKYRTEDSNQQALELELEPPCTFARPTYDSSSTETENGAPSGVRKAAAWRFGNGDLVIPVIGDQIPAEWHGQELYQLRKSQGLTCGASLQGVLVDPNGVRLSPKRERVGLFCAELGVSAKEAWLLADRE